MSPATLLRHVVALSGGVGGARLLDGLARVLPVGALACVVNAGDDFEHLGLAISPDLDTCMYTLAGLAPIERGWGLEDERFLALEMVRRYGGPDWFALGDRDLATHLVRTDALRRGETLTEVTARLASNLGVRTPLLPMADAPCRTILDTGEGTLSFQEWLVRRRGAPTVKRVRWDGDPPPAPGVLEAIERADLIVIGPSNPYVSIDPILARPGVRAAIARRPVVAVSPIVGGRAIKGPLAEMLPSLDGEAATAGAVLRHYGGLVTGFVVERGDEDGLPGAVLATDTVMRTIADRARLAEETLRFGASLVAAR